MWEQLNQAALRLEELETQLAQPETYENPDLVAALNREQKELTPLVETFHHYQGAQRELAGLDRKSTRLNSSHSRASRMPSSA